MGPLPKKENQLPKGNMWSVISVALPRLIVNLSEGEQGSGPQGKFPHMCESKGHRPLQGRCPAPSLNYNHNLLKQGTGTADHLTLLRLFLILTPGLSYGPFWAAAPKGQCPVGHRGNF